MLQLLVQPAACFAFLDPASRQPHEVQREVVRAGSWLRAPGRAFCGTGETGPSVHNGSGEWLKYTVLVARLTAAEAQVTT